MNTNFLKRMFEWSDEVVDAAQSPAAKLASTLLPILAPIVPAFITGIRLHGMYVELIAGRFPDGLATFGAVITALVLELLGWVGTIALVRNIYQWVKIRQDEYLIPASLSFLAYVIYIADMFAINSQKTSVDNVFLFLSLFSVPAGFMFAVMLVTNEDRRDAYQIRQEQREDRLKKAALKAGYNPFTPVLNQQVVPQIREKVASDYKDYAFELLDAEWKRNNHTLSPRELTTLVNKNKRVNLDHSKCKGTWSNFTKEWKQSRGL